MQRYAVNNDPGALMRAAMVRDVRTTRLVAFVLTGGVVLLVVGLAAGVIGLAGLAAFVGLDRLPAFASFTPDASQLGLGWLRSLLALSAFLLAAQLVTALLVEEHRHTLLSCRGSTPSMSRIAVLRLLIVVLTLGCVWAAGWAPATGRLSLAGEPALAALIVAAGQAAVAWACRDSRRRALRAVASDDERAAASHGTALDRVLVEGAWTPAAPPGSPVAPDLTGAPDPTEPTMVRAIAASGGGIRAAAFVLGGTQALAERAQEQPEPEPDVFAVSGGSYIAAAMALRRRFVGGTGTARSDVLTPPWTQAYRLGSPELERLRRNTRYLFEPPSALRDGAISLVVGMLVNILIVGAVLRFTAWFIAHLAATSGIVQTTGDEVSMRPGWARVAAIVIGIGVIVVGALSFLRWQGAAKRASGGGWENDLYRRSTRARRVVVGVVLALVVIWFVVPAAAVHGFDLLAADWQNQLGSIGGLFTVVLGLLVKGPAPGGSSTSRVGAVLRSLMVWVPLLIVGGVALYLLLSWTRAIMVGGGESGIVPSALAAAAVGLVAFLVNANATSMHGYYRERLSSGFAVGVDGQGRADQLPFSRRYRFSQLSDAPLGDPTDRTRIGSGPHLHIVTTLNTQHAGEAPTMRGGFPLVLGPATTDLFRESGRRVSLPTESWERFGGEQWTTIMAAVATSGAAVSPLMGRFATQMAPYRLLLTLFNLRVGVWVHNPAHALAACANPGQATAAAGNVHPRKPGMLWTTGRPGLAQVAWEALGRASVDDWWVYLSDGGHLDNTGMVEAVRHCVRMGSSGRVVVLDASNDPAGTWQAVGDAIAVLRADLSVHVVRTDDATEPPWMRRYVATLDTTATPPGATPFTLEIVVVKAVRVEADDPWHDSLPSDIKAFQATHGHFPRASTARQKFGDLEFEAYRALGYTCTIHAITHAGWQPTSS